MNEDVRFLARTMPRSVGTLNALVTRMHGDTCCVGQTLSSLIPFPLGVGSLADASIAAFVIRADACGSEDRSTARVETDVRYSSVATLSEALSFYQAELRAAGASGVRTTVADGARIGIEADLADFGGTRYRIVLEAQRRHTMVRISVSFEGVEWNDSLARIAEWHDGLAPVPEIASTGFEIATFVDGTDRQPIVLYTTRYECDDTPVAVMRSHVESRMSVRGWSYHEPVDGILFVRGCPFEAETHVYEKADKSGVAFVGEFRLAC